jgi:hypothetical protein
MRKFLWATLVLPLFTLSQQKATADNRYAPCWALHGLSGVKSLLHGGCGCCCSCGPCIGYNECCGVVPGPWYLYWPAGCPPVMSGPPAMGWSYADHFQVSAPVPYPCAPPPGTYPSYWYGR